MHRFMRETGHPHIWGLWNQSPLNFEGHAYFIQKCDKLLTYETLQIILTYRRWVKRSQSPNQCKQHAPVGLVQKQVKLVYGDSNQISGFRGQERKGRCNDLAQVGETPNKLVLKPGNYIGYSSRKAK